MGPPTSEIERERERARGIGWYLIEYGWARASPRASLKVCPVLWYFFPTTLPHTFVFPCYRVLYNNNNIIISFKKKPKYRSTSKLLCSLPGHLYTWIEVFFLKLLYKNHSSLVYFCLNILFRQRNPNICI